MRPTVMGTSPDRNNAIGWSRPSSYTRKRSDVSPATLCSRASVTVTGRTTISVRTEKVACWTMKRHASSRMAGPSRGAGPPDDQLTHRTIGRKPTQRQANRECDKAEQRNQRKGAGGAGQFLARCCRRRRRHGGWRWLGHRSRRRLRADRLSPDRLGGHYGRGVRIDGHYLNGLHRIDRGGVVERVVNRWNDDVRGRGKFLSTLPGINHLLAHGLRSEE